MSVYEYTEPPTITVNGVRLPVERVTFGALRSADPHVEAVVATRAAFAEMPHRVEFTVADDGGLFDRIARMVAEANREMEFLGPLSATPSRAQLRAHRAALARRFGLRRSEVRATVWRSTAWRASVVALRVRGRPTLTTCDGGAEGTRRALRWLRSVAP